MATENQQDTSVAAPFNLLARRAWDWGLAEFAQHLNENAADPVVRERFLQFQALAIAYRNLGERTLVRVLSDPPGKTANDPV